MQYYIKYKYYIAVESIDTSIASRKTNEQTHSNFEVVVVN